MLAFFRGIGIPVEDPAYPPVPEGPPDMDQIMDILDRHYRGVPKSGGHIGAAPTHLKLTPSPQSGGHMGAYRAGT